MALMALALMSWEEASGCVSKVGVHFTWIWNSNGHGNVGNVARPWTSVLFVHFFNIFSTRPRYQVVQGPWTARRNTKKSDIDDYGVNSRHGGTHWGHDVSMWIWYVHDVDTWRGWCGHDMTWPSVWKHDADRSTTMWKHVRLPTSDKETHCPSMCVSMSDVVMAMSVSVFFVTNSRIDSRDSDVLMIDFCFNRKTCKKGCSIWCISKHFQAHFETCDNVTMWQQWTGRHSVKPWNHGTLGWSILYKMPAKSHRLQSLHASTFHRHSSSLYTVLIFLILIPDFTRCFYFGSACHCQDTSFFLSEGLSPQFLLKIPNPAALATLASLATHFELQVVILLIPNSLFRVFHPLGTFCTFLSGKQIIWVGNLTWRVSFAACASVWPLG